MSADIAFEMRDNHLYVQLAGQPRLDAIKQQAQHLLGLCAQHACTKMLVDATGLSGLLSVSERYGLGLYFAEMWDPGVRIAVVVSMMELPEHEFFEDVARNRGVWVEMFVDQEEAMSWLEIGS